MKKYIFSALYFCYFSLPLVFFTVHGGNNNEIKLLAENRSLSLIDFPRDILRVIIYDWMIFQAQWKPDDSASMKNFTIANARPLYDNWSAKEFVKKIFPYLTLNRTIYDIQKEFLGDFASTNKKILEQQKKGAQGSYYLPYMPVSINDQTLFESFLQNVKITNLNNVIIKDSNASQALFAGEIENCTFEKVNFNAARIGSIDQQKKLARLSQRVIDNEKAMSLLDSHGKTYIKAHPDITIAEYINAFPNLFETITPPTIISSTIFENCTFVSAYFTCLLMIESHIKQSNLIQSILSNIVIKDSSVIKSNLENSQLISGRIIDTVFEDSKVKKTDFLGIEQKNMDFKNTSIKEVTFSKELPPVNQKTYKQETLQDSLSRIIPLIQEKTKLTDELKEQENTIKQSKAIYSEQDLWDNLTHSIENILIRYQQYHEKFESQKIKALKKSLKIAIDNIAITANNTKKDQRKLAKHTATIEKLNKEIQKIEHLVSVLTLLSQQSEKVIR